MVVHGRPKTPKIQVSGGSPSPHGSQSPCILGDTTRPGHVTCVRVWSKSDRRRLRKTLHKQTDKQTDRQTNRHYENNGHLAVNQYYCGLLNGAKMPMTLSDRWRSPQLPETFLNLIPPKTERVSAGSLPLYDMNTCCRTKLKSNNK